MAAGSRAVRAEVVKGWIQSLADFDHATKEFNVDGVPLAIEGIAALADYIESLMPAGDPQRFSNSLRSLAKANRAYAATKQTEDNFKD